MRYSKSLKIIVPIMIIVIYSFLKYPVSINKSYSGVRYRLGKDNHNEVKQITLDINGKIKKDLFLNKKFVGYIQISGIDDLIDNKYDDDTYKELFNSQLELKLDKFMRASLKYYMVKEFTGYSESIGDIYFEPTFSKFTICIYERVDYNTKSWSGADGIMISAPVTSRKEALEISNSIIVNNPKAKGVYKEFE